MDISKHFSPSETEDKWYRHWMDKGYFQSKPDDREPYTILIPPPNVTGVLHMGHMLNNTIQDVLIRRARSEGKNACWVPGTDHASIATEAKVVKWLREEKGFSKGELGREEFMKYAWEWTDKYGGIILKQLQKLGASADWDRTVFTMDEVRSDHVIKAFVDLYESGKLYRGLRMVNWDPEAKTVLSNEEVLYTAEQGKLYHVRYKLEDSEEYVVIATTRPETIVADTGVAVHPEDKKYAHLKGKKLRVPMTDRSVPVIFDDYVDREFGSGALKITPAHDPNDYEIGLRHELEVVDIFNPDATVNDKGGPLKGLDRFEARDRAEELLEQAGLLEKVEDHTHNVGRSERTNSVVEPRLSKQWYVNMKEIVKPALEAVEEKDIEFFPENMINTYRHWMNNIRDWCISRQLWWGHRIPAWYCEDRIFVAENEAQALEKARKEFNNPNLTEKDLRQDEDVLDTWFSSWLWPVSVFNGFRSKEEIDYYYPTTVLVTGWDIIFLWVARMIMAGYEWRGERPFRDVYFTGMVRDKQRRKMSKSLGNSPDALKLIDKYGADGVRFGMLSCSPAGGDLLFDENLCEQGRNFSNKIWNALRLVKGWEADPNQKTNDAEGIACTWMESRISQISVEMDSNFDQYRISEAMIKLYSVIWNDFCSWYLEIIKPGKGKTISGGLLEKTIGYFEDLMVLLHPFMPFVTEEIWQNLRERKYGEDCIVAEQPGRGVMDEEKLRAMDLVHNLVTRIREIRNKYGIPFSEKLDVKVECKGGELPSWLSGGYCQILEKFAKVNPIQSTPEHPEGWMCFLSGNSKYFVDAGKHLDLEAEKERLLKEKGQAEGFLKSVEKKLQNKRFVDNAPAKVVEKERKKQEDGTERLRIINESLKELQRLG
ncbi:MAG: valine--tRNA ligase [Saprospirales bacterium]|nr:MAG: valine--tRNA ligase [Saprospirales bacterium]